ncbi:MAG: hypothetical protein IPM74_13270 [Crocinitomicaceae bacterium]|nr:hypothetical protein [Crocinitomicaceae bacterium]MBK8926843.1 hypothetical protein [Crocinitomicaceae bacterium]
MIRSLILIMVVLIVAACRKDKTDLRLIFVGDYLFKKHSYYNCGECPPEYNSNTNYFYSGTVSTAVDEDYLEITGLGTVRFHKENFILGSADVVEYSYYGAGHGSFTSDTTFSIEAHDSYMGKSWGWSVSGTRLP